MASLLSTPRFHVVEPDIRAVYVRTRPLPAPAAVVERADAICIDLQLGSPPEHCFPVVLSLITDTVLIRWVTEFGVTTPPSQIRRDPLRIIRDFSLQDVRAVPESVPLDLRDPRFPYV
ncbi:hypothetical protein BJF83_22380 [Nocardiopsis sp. CNR-923]|nr:hypothetical protein BJF83_22380 [Nocardiopsis sp. CNR-923]